MNVVEMKNVSKYFPGTKAVDAVDFYLKQGEILSLLGENGAGKTTLMKVLYGMHSMDTGEIFFKGKPVQIKKPSDAIDLGICMVHQHFMLVSAFTVADNIIAGSEPCNGMFVDRKKEYQIIEELIKTFNFNIDPYAKVGKLSVGEQQRVEILKTLYREAEVIILDEPTAVLTPHEVDDLFVVLNSLRESGKSIVIITHKLKETKAIADRVMVLRDGKMIRDDVDPRAATFNELSDMMVGRHVELGTVERAKNFGEVKFSVHDLNLQEKGHTLLQDINLDIRSGEILGIAGIEGNGQSQLLDCITGLRTPQSMTVLVDGKSVSGGPSEFLHSGMAHIPEDRNAMGLVATMSISDNLILGYQDTPEFSSHGLLRKQVIEEQADTLRQEFLVKAPDSETKVGALSGGNAQKVIIARALSKNPKVLIVAQPTRGVDVGASEYIRGRIRQLRDEGAAILLVSADLDEVMQLSDRIAVIYEGKIVYETPADVLSDVELGMLMTGSSPEELKGAAHENA